MTPPADTTADLAATTPRSPRAPVLHDVMREHLEEMASLQIQRRSLCFDAEATATQLDRVSARLVAHWDGLVVGRPDSVKVASALLDEAFDPWDVAAAARAWLELGEPELPAVRERLEAADAELLGGWAEALRRSSSVVASRLLPLAVELDRDAAVLGALVKAWSWHGVLSTATAEKAAGSGTPAVRCSLARGLGWTAPADVDVGALLQHLCDDPDLRVRRAALWSGLLRDPAAGVAVCRRLADEPEPDPFAPMVLALLTAPVKDGHIEGEATGHEPGAIPMAALWRRSLAGDRADLAWLRREVPDGFFDAVAGDEVVPGE